MRLHARLPQDRQHPGELTFESDDGAVIIGPFPCRGKADSADAEIHGNPSRNPLFPYGDHPYGTSRIAAIEPGKLPAHTYGPCFLLLDPVSGDALIAKQNHRAGLGAHGGDPGQPGTLNELRATDGCLRTTNEAMTIIYPQVQVGDLYVCDELT